MYKNNPALTFHLDRGILEACYNIQLLPFCLHLSLDAIGAVCHQFGLLGIDLHLIPTGHRSKVIGPYPYLQ